MSIYALWRNGRISLPENVGKLGQRLVLSFLKWEIIRPLQFDTNGKIVNTASPLTIRQTRVPGTPVQWNELDKLTVATYQDVGGDLQILDLTIIRMFIGIQGVAEKLLDTSPSESSRREADRMYDQDIYRRPIRACVTIRRCHIRRALDESACRINLHDTVPLLCNPRWGHEETVADSPL